MTTNPRKLIDDPPKLTLLPSVSQRLFIGVDVAKKKHIAGFVSPLLLEKRKRFTRCPTLSFDNSRTGFERLVEAMKSYADLDQCSVLIEHTGHYSAALKQYLQEQHIEVYEMHASKRMSKEKTDKRDALNLANILYSQVHLGVQVLEEQQRVYRSLPLDNTAITLRTLMRRRYELERTATSRKNQLIAICDELFPEMSQIIKNPGNPTALGIRLAFPTPATIAAADTKDLIASRGRSSLPSNANMGKLQALARTTIGTKQPGRIYGLIIEQRQLIAELRMLEAHGTEIDAEIERIVKVSRQGKILISLPGIAAISAGEVIAAIGNIANFESASRLRGYFGWSPVRTQTGESKDSAKLDRGGRKPMKKAMYLIVWRAIQQDSVFKDNYERLVKSHCPYDASKNEYVGKNKVIGRICGQYIGVIFALLKADYDLLAALGDGEEPPEPTLYDSERHRAHRARQGNQRSNTDFVDVTDKIGSVIPQSPH